MNSPHNPTGTVLTDDELRQLAHLATDHDLLVITDEVYEHLVFDGRRHLPLAKYPGMRDRTVTISSAAKMFNCTGWKIGWFAAQRNSSKACGRPSSTSPMWAARPSAGRRVCAQP